ncbi:hypothetical protein DLJ82_6158 (plasmid) [Rhizobium leguminosarum]|uniref:Uncharacterized protein n=1 Tax=Rhizobium leguminosarum TaxID=384 RepID=A0A2Z4YST7_RHILE|nr:hypothetical protein DLJ82_6158 [Rhizobium leguminosarum]
MTWMRIGTGQGRLDTPVLGGINVNVIIAWFDEPGGLMGHKGNSCYLWEWVERADRTNPSPPSRRLNCQKRHSFRELRTLRVNAEVSDVLNMWDVEGSDAGGQMMSLMARGTLCT